MRCHGFCWLCCSRRRLALFLATTAQRLSKSVHIENTAAYVAPVIAFALGWLQLGDR
jgi:hypothetical protein